jgi:aryl-alcohol dehydrogenase-like predicted oxidoreductase
MQYTNLGRSGLKVSRLCLGTMNYGPHTPEPDAHAQMDAAVERGINFIDTADVYGWKKGEGVTEQLIGRWVERAGARKRDQVVLATKVYGEMGDGPNDRGLSAYHIRAACEGSLRRLKTDRIDLYQMHHIDHSVQWEEIWQATEQLVRQGKVIYVGSSNFAGWHIATAMQEARRRGNFMGMISEQCKYSLACRHVELEVLPACRGYGLGAIPWSPLDGGILAGVLGSADKGGRRSSDKIRPKIERLRPQLERWERFCKELGERPADVALAWTLHHPAVAAPIIGPRTMEQLVDSLRAMEIKLSPEVLKRLDEIWPPAGHPDVQPQNTSENRLEGPEAWAW